MESLRDLELFVAVVEGGNLTAAARRLGRSLQAVSRSLQELEGDAGITLIRRTTRRCQLTPAGQRFYERVKAILADLATARAELTEEGQAPAGHLRVNGPSLFGPRFLTPLLAAFLDRHPGVTATLDLSEDYVDPTTSGADVIVRIGETPDSSLMSRKLGAVRRVTVATPGYLAVHGRPNHPLDLGGHLCVLRTGRGDPDRWTFRGDDGVQTVKVHGRFESNQVAAVNQAVLEGLGIGVAAFWQMREMIAQGRLEVILSDYELAPLPLQALWTRTGRLPVRVRLFIDFLAARLSQESL